MSFYSEYRAQTTIYRFSRVIYSRVPRQKSESVSFYTVQPVHTNFTTLDVKGICDITFRLAGSGVHVLFKGIDSDNHVQILFKYK